MPLDWNDVNEHGPISIRQRPRRETLLSDQSRAWREAAETLLLGILIALLFGLVLAAALAAWAAEQS